MSFLRKSAAPASGKRWFRLPFIAVFMAAAFLSPAGADTENNLGLPAPGTMVGTSAEFTPALLKGLRFYARDPLRFDFIIDTGYETLSPSALREESRKLAAYFLATLTIPSRDLWVNLSPYEEDRIIPGSLSQTEMGRDLLAQDYLLKQLTASLIYPEKEMGQEFWERIYQKAVRIYGTTDIPVNTFNKVWIVPETAVVYESGDTVFIAESRLKVMLEEDYLALERNAQDAVIGTRRLKEKDVKQLSEISSRVVRELILPEIEKEVNQGKNFQGLRQMYGAMILGVWFKKNLRETLVSRIYADKNRTAGIELDDKNIKEQIYHQYLEAFRRGVYDYIREEYDVHEKKPLARRYFSGGFQGDVIKDILLGGKVTPVGLLQTAESSRTGSYQTASVYLEPVRSLENLLRILKSIAASDEVINIGEEAGEDVILTEIVDYLKKRGSGRVAWVTETADEEGNLVVALDERLKRTPLGQAVVENVLTGAGRLGAVNFKGQDGVWRIMGFETDLAGNLPVEQREVFYRKQGLTWIEAYNRTRLELFDGEGIVDPREAGAFRAGRQDIISASALLSSSPLLQELQNFRQILVSGDSLSETDQKRLEAIISEQGFAYVFPHYASQPGEVLDSLIFLLRFDQQAYAATAQTSREDTARYIIRQLSNRWTAHELNHFSYPVKLAQVTLGLQMDRLAAADKDALQLIFDRAGAVEQTLSTIRYILGAFEVFRSGSRAVYLLDEIKAFLDREEATAFQLLKLGETYQDMDPDIILFLNSGRNIIREIQHLKATIVSWETNNAGKLPDSIALAREVQSMTMTLARDREEAITVNVDIPQDLRLRMSRYDLFNFLKVLVDNAFQAASGDRSPQVAIDLNGLSDNGRERVEIKIRDNGRGMTSEQLAKVREGIQFTTKAQFGSGEGLMSVRNLTQLYEGTMAVDSKVGEGTVFTFTFPVQPDAPEAPSSPLALSSALSRGPENLGGIDFTADNLNLQTSGKRIAFQFPYTSDQLEDIAINGLQPVVIRVAPADLPLLLSPAE